MMRKSECASHSAKIRTALDIPQAVRIRPRTCYRWNMTSQWCDPGSFEEQSPAEQGAARWGEELATQQRKCEGLHSVEPDQAQQPAQKAIADRDPCGRAHQRDVMQPLHRRQRSDQRPATDPVLLPPNPRRDE